jgi:hypothetical protein
LPLASRTESTATAIAACADTTSDFLENRAFPNNASTVITLKCAGVTSENCGKSHAWRTDLALMLRDALYQMIANRIFNPVTLVARQRAVSGQRKQLLIKGNRLWQRKGN